MVMASCQPILAAPEREAGIWLLNQGRPERISNFQKYWEHEFQLNFYIFFQLDKSRLIVWLWLFPLFVGAEVCNRLRCVPEVGLRLIADLQSAPKQS